MSDKIHSADIQPQHGHHYLLINGVEAGRFDSIRKALAAREVVLQPDNMPELSPAELLAIEKAGGWDEWSRQAEVEQMNPID